MTMLTYSKYKDSGVDWIGEIPEGWKTIMSGAIFLDSKERGISSDEVLSSTQNDGVIPKRMLESVVQNAEDADLSSFKKVRVNDGIISLRSFQGGIEFNERYEGKITPAYTVIRSRKTECIAFFKYLLKSKQYIAMLDANTSGIRQGKTIRYQDFKTIPLPYPSAIEQQAIANYLDEKTAAIDAAMADIERSIELLNEYRQSVISEAVTKGLDHDAPMKDSGINWIGDIPLQWTVTKIINLATRKSGHTPDKKKEEYWQNGDIVWISLADSPALRKHHYVSESNTMTNMEGINHSSAELLPPGTVLLSRDASIGLTAIAATELAVSQHFMAYICGPKLYNEYLYYTFESMQQELNRLSMGSTIPTIGLPLIHGLRIPVPPIEEQHEIVDCLQHKLNELDSLIAQKQSLIVRLKEYRSSLISECVTGKVKVPGVKED
ncbi:restriction endonuclease subunit S [Bifidobacterium jacchi]|uniref:Restriction endonuclease subunit S n=1 Tax=Bifidobacterium jacchi TaxID=2490545 RepID=A0A5N5RCC7_9BIFI|nr:restriction endonuclease subunit S [Bifidobacterium jacchi]KAB5604136.1 restriction endonuclease subunit S [Bifidobacterium jacchi]